MRNYDTEQDKIVVLKEGQISLSKFQKFVYERILNSLTVVPLGGILNPSS